MSAPGLPRDLDDALPPVLAAIAAVAGVEVALLIARTHGGTRMLMPVAPGRNWLTQLVGEKAALVIIDELGGARTIDVPLGPQSGFVGDIRRQLRRRYRELEARGDAGAQFIARTLGTTDRTVRRWRAKARSSANAAQADLFDDEDR